MLGRWLRHGWRWLTEPLVTGSRRAPSGTHSPRLDDLHPWLRERIANLARAHQQRYPDRSLALITTWRSHAEELDAIAKGTSELSPSQYSLHGYRPCLACDVWVYTDGPEVDGVLYEYRPDRDAGATLRLMQRGSLSDYYEPMGELAERHGLEWGGRWRTLRDGPHVQVPQAERIRLLQEALRSRGYYLDGLVDGLYGPRTERAVERATEDSGVGYLVGWRQRRLMPVHPDVWAWLHGLPTETEASA